MPADLAIRPNPRTGRCGLVISAAGPVLDSTPRSAMLYALLSDRRALADDQLPHPMPEDPAAPATLLARRGYSGDALDPNGELTGSRLWLLARAKMPEALARGRSMALDALAPLTRRGLAVEVRVEQVAAQRMRLVSQAGLTTVAVVQAVG